MTIMKQTRIFIVGVVLAAALLANPTADEARALVAAIQGQDLSGEVGGMLPAKDSYK